jgi:hypothetical protein
MSALSILRHSPTFRPLSGSAFSARAALACEVAFYCSQWKHPWVKVWMGNIDALTREAGRRTAAEGGDLQSPLVDVAAQACEGIRRLFEFSYWSHAPSLDPATYFDVLVDGRFIQIASLKVAGGDGLLRLHERHLPGFFERIRTLEVDSYEAWAFDPCPGGGRPVMYREPAFEGEPSIHDDAAAPRAAYGDRTGGHLLSRCPSSHEGMLVLDPDTHPSDGSLILGDPSQELRQLAALARVEQLATNLLAANAPTQADREAAEQRAATINARVTLSFMPPSGYCSTCGFDVTLQLLERGADQPITGCPCCWRSWCD